MKYKVARGQTAVVRVTVKKNNIVQGVSDYDLFRLDIGVPGTTTVVVTKSTAVTGEGEITDTLGVVEFYLTSADTLLLAGPTYVAEVWGKSSSDRVFLRWPDCSVTLEMFQPLAAPPA